MRGVPLDANGQFAGSFIGLLNPYALIIGLLGFAMFATHGAIFLVTKTDAECAETAKGWAMLAWKIYAILFIVATISTFIAMNAALVSAVAVMHALTRDHYITQKLLKKSKISDIPILILIITSGIAILFTILSFLFANVGFTANITTFIYFFGLAFVNFAAVNLRYKRKELDRPFKAPFFPYLPLIVGSTCLFLAFALNIEAVLLGIVILVIGITYYLLTIADRHSIIFTLCLPVPAS